MSHLPRRRRAARLDALARGAASAGLVAPEKTERMLRERLRADRIERMKTARAALAAEPLTRLPAAGQSGNGHGAGRPCRFF
jgi:hypothetical protein